MTSTNEQERVTPIYELTQNHESWVTQKIERLKGLRDPRLLHFSGLTLIDNNPESWFVSLNVGQLVLIKKAGYRQYDNSSYLVKISLDTKTYTGGALKFTVNPGIASLNESQRLIAHGLAASYCDPKPINFPLFNYEFADPENYREEFKQFVREIYNPPTKYDKLHELLRIFQDPRALNING